MNIDIADSYVLERVLLFQQIRWCIQNESLEELTVTLSVVI